MKWPWILFAGTAIGLAVDDETLTEQLHRAVIDGNVDQVQELLVEKKASLGDRPERFADWLKNPKILELLLDHGFEPNGLEGEYRMRVWEFASQSPAT
ncbi:MAG: hypothetical protein AAGH89_19250, partial [Verrucomicrobiota bacterium]